MNVSSANSAIANQSMYASQLVSTDYGHAGSQGIMPGGCQQLPGVCNSIENQLLKLVDKMMDLVSSLLGQLLESFSGSGSKSGGGLFDGILELLGGVFGGGKGGKEGGSAFSGIAEMIGGFFGGGSGGKGGGWMSTVGNLIGSFF